MNSTVVGKAFTKRLLISRLDNIILTRVSYTSKSPTILVSY